MPKPTTSEYDFAFQQAGIRYNTDWRLLKAQARQESGPDLDPYAKGPNTRYGRAIGIMQILWSTFKEIGVDGDGDGKIDIYNVADAVHSAANYRVKIRKWLNAEINGVIFKRKEPIEITERMVLASYNWGMGNVAKHIKRHGKLLMSRLPKETSDYIYRIENFYREFQLVETPVI